MIRANRKSSPFLYGVVMSVMILVLGAGVALAQAVFGVITGNVTDPSGASIPKAKVITRDLDRGTTFDTP